MDEDKPAAAAGAEAAGTGVERPQFWRRDRDAIGRKLPRRALTRDKRATFLEVLATTSNVEEAARAAGVTARAFYFLRDRDGGFAADWQAAIAEGQEALETGLLAHARGTADADDTLNPAMAMMMLKRYDAVRAGKPLGRGSIARNLPLRAVCDELLRRIATAARRLEWDGR